MGEGLKAGITGVGYAGLGACLAHIRDRVTCIDEVERRVAELTGSWVQVYEPDLRGRRGEVPGAHLEAAAYREVADSSDTSPAFVVSPAAYALQSTREQGRPSTVFAGEETS